MRTDSRPVRITATVLSILLALLFLAAGLSKLLGGAGLERGTAPLR